MPPEPPAGFPRLPHEGDTLYHDLVETSQDLIWQCDNEGRYTFLNAAWEATFGYPLAEMLGRRFSEFQTPAMGQRDLREFKRLLDGGTVRGYETVHLARDGREIHLVFNAKYVRDPNGTILGTRGTAYDITARKQMEAALKESEARFRTIVEASPMGMYLYTLTDDDRLVFQGANPAADRMVGVDHRPFIGKTLEEVFPPLAHTEVPARYRAAARHGRQWRTEQIDYRHGQIQGAFEVVAFQTEPGSMVALFNEITERKRTEANLAQERERLAVTLRSIGDGVIATDMAGAVVLMNQVAERLTGWPQAEALGRPLPEVFAIVDERTDAPCDSPVARVLASGGIIELANHTVLIARDGTRRPIADSGAPIRDARGEAMGVALVFRDMTEKRRLLEAAQNTQKLEALGVLAGGIAHDFNNLLGGIFGFVDLALLRTEDPQVRSYLESSLAAMDRARALAHQLLTFARGGEPVLQSGRLLPVLEKTASFATSGSHVGCAFDLDPGLWHCTFDANQLGQVIDNLLINARQSMPLGGVITVRARNRTLGAAEQANLPPGRYVEVAIVDQGIGIPPEILPRIFDPFFTTKHTGSGLGLATSYSIMSRHGGAIEVESEPGRGSTFRIYLPASAAPEEMSSTPPAARHRGAGAVLLMDDEPLLREAFAAFLTELGYTPTCVADGEQALAAFTAARQAGSPFAALVLDLTIPGGMGGVETARRIRAQDPSVPLFVASGYAEDPVLARPGAFGFTDSIRKPFTLAELAKVLQRNVGGK